MDGLAAVTARVQQIQGLVQSMQPTPVRTVVASASGTAFDSALAQAARARGGATAAPTGATGVTGPATGATRAAGTAAGVGAAGASTAVDSEGVPLALKAYGNGKVPASALQEIGDGRHRLWAPAADAFGRLRAAARADGVSIGVTDSYRSYEAQVDVARRKGLYKNGGLAAVPGTSDHGWGLSLDLKLDGSAQAWMRSNAGRFGFDENTPREPWHWTFQP